MEMTVNMGAFEQLDNRWMMGVDGGVVPRVVFIGGIVVGWVADGIVEAATGKDVGSWIATGIKYILP